MLVSRLDWYDQTKTYPSSPQLIGRRRPHKQRNRTGRKDFTRAPRPLPWPVAPTSLQLGSPSGIPARRRKQPRGSTHPDGEDQKRALKNEKRVMSGPQWQQLLPYFLAVGAHEASIGHNESEPAVPIYAFEGTYRVLGIAVMPAV